MHQITLDGSSLHMNRRSPRPSLLALAALALAFGCSSDDGSETTPGAQPGPGVTQPPADTTGMPAAPGEPAPAPAPGDDVDRVDEGAPGDIGLEPSAPPADG